MKAPAFWRHDGLPARLLAPLGALYGAAAARRLARAAPSAPAPVVMIGGLTAGGDGKTPLAIALAHRLAALGARPALLTRGYGRLTRHEPIVVDPERHDADDIGDEALLLARAAPTIVGADRVASAQCAKALGATILIMDDGFHSRRLAPDLTLLAINADYGAGNGRCLPAGPLRAPLEAQLAAADMLVAIGDGAAGDALAPGFDKPALKARMLLAQDLAGARAVAFAGIARPETFFRSLEEAGADIVARRAFPDHHRYTPREREDLAALAESHGARLLTTEKDAARLGSLMAQYGVEAVAAQLVFDDASALDTALAQLIASWRTDFEATSSFET